MPFVPKHTLTVGGQYIFRINPGYWLERIQLNAGYTGAGRVYWTEENTVSQSFYGTLNGRISFQKGRGQIDFWVRNALTKITPPSISKAWATDLCRKDAPSRPE